MKYIKLKEAYIQSPVYRVNLLIDEIVNKVKIWFETGSFSKSCNLYDLKKSSMTESTEKNVIVDFGNDDNNYQLIITLKLEDATSKDPTKRKEIENCNIKIKKYDINSPDNILLPPLSSDIKIKDLNEDFILQKIADLDTNLEKDDITTGEEPNPEAQEKPQAQGQTPQGQTPQGQVPPQGQGGGEEGQPQMQF
jgi:hypothetical protein